MLAALALIASIAEDVFVSKSLDPAQVFDTFRIPAICRTRKGTLLAFAEGRRSVHDQASNVIVLRRRPSRSRGWSELQIVVRDEPASLNNPCVLATRGGRIWLMYQRYPHGGSEYGVSLGYDPERTCRSFVTSSDDDGLHWSAPRDVTETVRRADVRTVASGPGVGVELSRGPHRGRLLFPFNEGKDRAWTVFGVFSDDGGRTWKSGAPAPKAPGTQPNEVQFAELGDGSVLLNARNQAAGRFRLSARSGDGGMSWSMAEPVPDLVDPVCMGSLVRVGGRPDLLAFSNAASPAKRENGQLRISRDGGRTWSLAATVTPGSFAYSCLVPMPRNEVGILYETTEPLPGGGEGYRIRYQTLPLPH